VVVGLVVMVMERGQSYLRPEYRPLAWLAELVVAPEARRRGVARALIAAAEGRARAAGARRMMIGAIVGNEGELATYRGLGYTDRLIELAKEL
jgi:GNAT superfamily N-acetyltransferase